MIEFVNRFTGGRMWVADNRAGEYVAAGHTPAAFPAAKKPADVADEMKQTVRKIKRTKKDGNSK